MILVIMAAGMGSRYGGLKQLDPVGPNGEFILDYSIYDAKRAGFNKVVFVIKEENLELFRETIGKRIEKAISVEYAFQKIETLPEKTLKYIDEGRIIIPEERKKPWGTAHAVYCCADAVDEDFAVINSDDFYGREAFELLYKHMTAVRENNHRNDRQEYCMVGYRLKNTLTENGHVSRGVCKADEKGMLADITEYTKIQKEEDGALRNRDGVCDCELEPDTIVSMNCWGFTKSLFTALTGGMHDFMYKNREELGKSEYYLLSVVQDGIEKGECGVRILDTAERWFGVTYKEDRESVAASIRKLIGQGIYPERLWDLQTEVL